MDALIDPVISMLRSKLDRTVLVSPYGGEFTSDEVGRLSFACPAVLVASAGWLSKYTSSLMVRRAGFRACRMTAFVATKSGTREDRMRQASRLAEWVHLALEAWDGGHTDVFVLAPPELDSIRAENLYSAKIDKAGLALWAVSWTQCVQSKRVLTPAQLFELVAIDITDTVAAATSPTSPTPAPPSLVVTDEIIFKGA